MHGLLGRSSAIGRSMQHHAELSACGNYRYAISRVWDSQLSRVLFICLNPSTADADLDDPSLRRCIRFAQAWGYGGVVMGNLFAFRATRPRVLSDVQDPIGPENDRWLTRLRAASEVAVAAWGNRGALQDRARIVTARPGKLYCLGRTASGAPRHPLYVSGTTQLQNWTV